MTTTTPTTDTLPALPPWVRTYASYEAARERGGWATICRDSSSPPPPGWIGPGTATYYGYRSVRQDTKHITAYILVASSIRLGYAGRAAKTYYSVWGR